MSQPIAAQPPAARTASPGGVPCPADVAGLRHVIVAAAGWPVAVAMHPATAERRAAVIATRAGRPA